MIDGAAVLLRLFRSFLIRAASHGRPEGTIFYCYCYCYYCDVIRCVFDKLSSCAHCRRVTRFYRLRRPLSSATNVLFFPPPLPRPDLFLRTLQLDFGLKTSCPRKRIYARNTRLVWGGGRPSRYVDRGGVSFGQGWKPTLLFFFFFCRLCSGFEDRLRRTLGFKHSLKTYRFRADLFWGPLSGDTSVAPITTLR